MSLESYIRALPKVELHVHLEGAILKQTLLTIAEQNDISDNTKHFADWVHLFDHPDYSRLDDLAQTYCAWLEQPEDITRIVYDLGVTLYKQNVRYAEVSVNPIAFMQSGIPFETLLDALNDGRSRVERGWGVRMGWILSIPRNEPRRADEIARWATSTAGKKGGVIALGLSGREDAQPAGQFERAFRTAEKKNLPLTAHAGGVLHAEGILDVLTTLNPVRLYDGWGAADAPDVLTRLADQQIALGVSMAGALCKGQAKRYADYPLRALVDAGVPVVIGADMPGYFKTSITEEYFAAVEHAGLHIDELEETVLNSIAYSMLAPEEKAALTEEFKAEFLRLRQEHDVAEGG